MPKQVKEAYDKMHEYFKKKRRETLDYWCRLRREKKSHTTGNMER